MVKMLSKTQSPSVKLVFCSQEVRTTNRWQTDVWEERWLGLCLSFPNYLGKKGNRDDISEKGINHMEKRLETKGMVARVGPKDFQKQHHRSRSSHCKEFLLNEVLKISNSSYFWKHKETFLGEGEHKQEGQREEKESQADSMLSMEPNTGLDMGLDLTT